MSRLEGWGARKAPHLFWSARLGSLLFCFASLFFWAYFGFNLPEGSVPIIGAQWSTFATVAFFFWAIMVSFQTGNLPKLGNLKMDLWFIIHPTKRSLYPKDAAFSPFIGAVTGFCAILCAAYAFEAIWVPLYDWFQFGSVWWPVYAYSPKVFVADDILPTLCFFVAAMLLPWNFMREGSQNASSWRFDANWLCIVGLAALLWLEWVMLPHSTAGIPLVLTNVGGHYVPGACYVMPSQGFFPQNTYTFYPCAIKGVSGYSILQIFGFFDPDNLIHTVNVLTKFVTFAAICYPFMVRKRWPD